MLKDIYKIVFKSNIYYDCICAKGYEYVIFNIKIN